MELLFFWFNRIYPSPLVHIDWVSFRIILLFLTTVSFFFWSICDILISKPLHASVLLIWLDTGSHVLNSARCKDFHPSCPPILPGLTDRVLHTTCVQFANKDVGRLQCRCRIYRSRCIYRQKVNFSSKNPRKYECNSTIRKSEY